ncbi:MAG: TRAP transporter small permease [Emcibacteraceae bacterium]|nr:TRAP transporter small permease [Emcibacteraceae bacterium]MDG1859172.1 TRAP transporter small permease [Emcibacteraceae bacterium]
MSSEFYKKMDYIDHKLALILCAFAGLSVVAMMLHIVAGIYSRHFLGQPLGGVTEIVSAYDMVAVSFLSLAYVTHQKAHIAVDLFTQKLSLHMKEIIDLGAALFVTILSIWITYETAIAALHSYTINEVWESGDGFLTVWPSRFFLPIGIGAMAFTYALDTLKRADRLINSSSLSEDL